MIEHIVTVLCVHGEGCRETVNMLRRNALVASVMAAGKSRELAERETSDPDSPPDIIVLLRDDAHGNRIERPVDTWEEVELWKQLAGYDEEKRQWKCGARVKVTFDAIPEGV